MSSIWENKLRQLRAAQQEQGQRREPSSREKTEALRQEREQREREHGQHREPSWREKLEDLRRRQREAQVKSPNPCNLG